MANFTRKTYDNSYLFNQEADLHHKVLTEYIIKAERIDKKSDAFRGIIEDVKRMQSSSVLYTILMMDNVNLCIGKGAGLPRAFKVFEAKDIAGDHQSAIFIDVTNIIVYKDGYFTCKKIDWLITYLFNALGYLLYSKSTMKLIGNSAVSISATECFVSMFTYIIDYLRIIGFAQNKEKISYLTGLYFQYHLMGKDIDTYAKNIAAKVAGVSTSDTRAFELYYDPEKDFFNIDSFVRLIAETFKLKGFTLETFIHRWNYSFGDGSYYATELLTSFLTLQTSAFCGSYIVNQKQIERCCGASMVKLCNALIQIGTEEFDKRGYMEASELDATIARDKNTQVLRESLLNRKKVPDDCKFVKEDFASKARAKERVNKMIAYYRSSEQENKISDKIKLAAYGAMGAQGQYNVKGEPGIYETGVIEIILKAGKSYLNDRDKRILSNEIKASCDALPGAIKKCAADKEKAKRFSVALVELRKCLAYV